MTILRKMDISNLAITDATNHAAYRNQRFQYVINQGCGEPVAAFLVDKGHENGPEIHTITSKSFIVIQNARTKKLITVLIARPGQIRRYFTDGKIPADFDELIEQAENNTNLNLNNL